LILFWAEAARGCKQAMMVGGCTWHMLCAKWCPKV